MADEPLVLVLHDPKEHGDKKLNVAFVLTPEERALPRNDFNTLVQKRLWSVWRTWEEHHG